MNPRQLRKLAAIVLLPLTLASCVHIGQRLLHIEVEVDGVVAFEGIRGVPDNMPVEKMWTVLGDVPFEPTAAYRDGATGSAPGELPLTGAVIVRIKHVDRVLDKSSVPSLKLIHDPAGTWRLADGEAERLEAASDRSG